MPERATLLLEEHDFREWLRQPGQPGGDRHAAAAEALARSAFRTRVALSRCEPEDLRPLGVRGGDAARVIARARSELPRLEEGALVAMQREADDELARALARDASALMDTVDDPALDDADSDAT